MNNFVDGITSRDTWLRIAMIVSGSILVLMALWNSSPVNQLAQSMNRATRLAA